MSKTYEEKRAKRDIGIKYIPNCYGLKVYSLPDPLKCDVEDNPWKDVNFYIVQRGYLKTIYNLLRDAYDIITYNTNVYPQEKNEELQDLKTAIGLKIDMLDKIFESLHPGEQLTKEYQNSMYKDNGKRKYIRFYDIEKDVFLLNLDDNDKTRYPINSSYYITSTPDLFNLMDLVADIDVFYEEYCNIHSKMPFSMHQVAAINYFNFILTGKYL